MKRPDSQATPKRGIRRLLGLSLLIVLHIIYLLWCGLMAIFTPRYRRIFPFQARYSRDVLIAEMRRTRDQKP